jgi:hypothetical protein
MFFQGLCPALPSALLYTILFGSTGSYTKINADALYTMQQFSVSNNCFLNHKNPSNYP